MIIIGARAAIPMALVFFAGTAIANNNTEALSLNCNGCHGPEGVSHGEYIPSISGLNYRYFMSTMLKFKKDERLSTIMGRMARGYKLKELRAISRYFAGKNWGNAADKIDPALVRRGAGIHQEHCEECHQDDGRFQDKEIPRIAGQWGGYLLLQLQDYQTGNPFMPQPEKMLQRLEPLDEEDLRALSHFYSSRI